MKPEGNVIFSFLEYSRTSHWFIFFETQKQVRAGTVIISTRSSSVKLFAAGPKNYTTKLKAFKTSLWVKRSAF